MEDWIRHTKELLEIERQADLDEALEYLTLKDEREGTATLKTVNPRTIRHLIVDSILTGLFGKSVVQLKTRHTSHNGGYLPSHTLSSGDIVQIQSMSGGGTSSNSSSRTSSPRGDVQGTVSRVQNTSLSIVLDDNHNNIDELKEPLRITKLMNDASYRKIQKGLSHLEKDSHRVSDCVFGSRIPSSININDHKFEARENIRIPFNPNLNEPQLNAVEFALSSQDIALIHGPPGTGASVPS